MHRKDENPITLLSFVLGRYSSDFLLGLRGHLWVSIARRYFILKKEIAEKTFDEVIGRISFACDDTLVEYEYSKLTKKSMLTLFLIVQFIREYPVTEKIRISREGPILVSFRNYSTGNSTAKPLVTPGS